MLTAALPTALQREADSIRSARRPEAAAHAPAHLTLFRHLPGPRFDALLRDVRAIVSAAAAPAVRVEPPRLRNGLWLAPCRSEPLDALREALAGRWHGLLAPGDIAPPWLHLSLARGGAAPPALPEGPWRLPGLLLWQYGQACWSPLVAVAFRR